MALQHCKTKTHFQNAHQMSNNDREMTCPNNKYSVLCAGYNFGPNLAQEVLIYRPTDPSLHHQNLTSLTSLVVCRLQDTGKYTKN